MDDVSGARMSWSNMNNEGVMRRVLFSHPPYKKGTGYVFARYRVKIPAKGLILSTKLAKSVGSTPGDGILFRVAVRTDPESALETVCEQTVTDYRWHDFSADLSRWAGRKIDLYLISDPGPADNTYGDGGGWGDLELILKN